jgi:hypothetical protein
MVPSSATDRTMPEIHRPALGSALGALWAWLKEGPGWGGSRVMF